MPWRPPGNRTPTPQETATCRPFIERQIELCDPDFLICMGAPAAAELMGNREGILKFRGRWHEFDTGSRKIRAMATLHPAYLLRQPLQKRLAWRDFLTLKEALDAGATRRPTPGVIGQPCIRRARRRTSWDFDSPPPPVKWLPSSSPSPPFFSVRRFLQIAGSMHGLLLAVRGTVGRLHHDRTRPARHRLGDRLRRGLHPHPDIVRRVGHVRAYGAIASVAAVTILLNLLIVSAPCLDPVCAPSPALPFAGASMIVESWLNERA